jgi:methyl-accepting chemotaxis protein
MFKKTFGLILLIIALVGLAISAFGVVISRQVFNDVGTRLDNTLNLAGDSLHTVTATLELTKDTVIEVEDGLNTVGITAEEASQAIDDTQPLLLQITDVATGDVPDSLEAVEDSIPDIAEAAGAIDETLRILNSFELNRQIFGVPIRFDLGIEYEPEASLDETVYRLGDSLDGIPETLRDLEVSMTSLNSNLNTIGMNVLTISKDLDQINKQIGEIEPLIDEYIHLVEETDQLIVEAQNSLSQLIDTLTFVATALFVWMGMNQLVPLYLAWTLLFEPDSHEDDEVQSDDKEEPTNNNNISDSSGGL